MTEKLHLLEQNDTPYVSKHARYFFDHKINF